MSCNLHYNKSVEPGLIELIAQNAIALQASNFQEEVYWVELNIGLVMLFSDHALVILLAEVTLMFYLTILA